MKKFVTHASRRQISPNWLQDFFRRYTFLSLLGLSIVAGMLFGLTVAYQASMTEEAQQVVALANYRPNLVTRVLAADGKTVIGEFSVERRIPITYDEIPNKMKEAIWAIEDDRFFQHIGVDPIRVTMAAYKNVIQGRKAEGASTLTQQLARNLFLSSEKTYERKIKEILLSLQIERYYTKEQIMEMYCNQIFLGGGSYGFEAGAQYYFSKPLKELSLEECAMLAGLPKAPSQYSPTRDERAALDRRNLVLLRMKQEGYITDDEYNKARQTHINLNINAQTSNNNSIYGYFVEEVRQEAEDTFGTTQTHTGGMNIYSTLDAKAQAEAVRAVRSGLHAYEDRHGKKWHGKLTNVLDAKMTNDLTHFAHADWMGDYRAGDYLYGLVMGVTPAGADIRFGDHKAYITEANTKWAGGSPARLLKRGDLAVFKVTKVEADKKTLEVNLDQLPSVDGALVCLDAKTGEVKAMVGGYDFSTRKFNNATQAERQCGSAFKPFIYTAAIEAGFTPDTPINAGPFVDPATGWSPHNYDGSSGGGILTLRSALQQSVNVVAVRLLSIVGVDKGAEMVKRFGLPNPMKRVLPSALGATEEPLLDMTSAYSSFPNEGVRIKPHLIKQVTDADSNVLEKWDSGPNSYRVISPFVASQMRELMRGVVTGGTAASIMGNKELSKRMICGKTGTVNDFTDAWFLGYTPSYTCGVWIGYPGLKKSLGNKEAGSVAALPMWVHFMEPFLRDKPNDQFPKAPGPDKEILARRADAERAMMKEQASETGGDTEEDPNAGRAKSAAQDDEKLGGRPRLSASPAPGDSDRGQRPPVREIRPNPTDIDRTPPRRPPAPKVEDDKSDKAKAKRGKNG
jgi:penicillin-binding protein 1A